MIPFAVQAESLLKAASAELAANWPPPGVPPKFNIDLGTSGGSIIDPQATPLPTGLKSTLAYSGSSEPGLVMNVDYVMNRGVHFSSICWIATAWAPPIRFDLAAGQAAWMRRLPDLAARAGSNSANIDCVIANGGVTSRLSPTMASVPDLGWTDLPSEEGIETSEPVSHH